jgi:hypothetical protein
MTPTSYRSAILMLKAQSAINMNNKSLLLNICFKYNPINQQTNEQKPKLVNPNAQ